MAASTSLSSQEETFQIVLSHVGTLTKTKELPDAELAGLSSSKSGGKAHHNEEILGRSMLVQAGPNGPYSSDSMLF